MKHIFILILLSTTFCTFSQTKVSGVVVDNAGVSVPFANVVFKDSRDGTITDENGRFYLESNTTYSTVVFSFIGYVSKEVTLEKRINYEMRVVLDEETSQLDEVVIFGGKTSKKDNPAIDILRKIWENRRENGVKKFKQYQYDKYEKLEFDINTIDSSFMNSRIFKGMEFVFDFTDTSRVTGKTFLPIFINEAISRVYGDNLTNQEKEVLEGNKNSGFSNNQTIIEFVKDLYSDYDVYDNYLKFFDKAFTSPLSTTGIDVYNYVLNDSAYIDNKWCYNIIY
nr:carboxypeptidase-like regulatory domain-containing protein [Flavobacteriales bacterium]